MTKIEKIIKDVSDLHQFYAKIQKRKKIKKITKNKAKVLAGAPNKSLHPTKKLALFGR
ncbi:MAG: hypothetical protein DDT42_01375 [candidate division WS2 bacterium]|uniref:Uncharacterized protein n=1 Tax=Psychracetigena formicireducens TaxID=2986056 RepID=A0A9E2BI61_PSYF1|nr:hypothetical protein [Candidatus Psychracetigena formicireducens]MBT9146596.1 hypothetical protein [Bacillota bacterium]